MSFKGIAFSLMLIMIALFALSGMYIRREKKNSVLEVAYFEALKKAKQGHDPKDAMRIGCDFYVSRGLSREKSVLKVQSDLALS
jgi:hypothetical protein